MSLSIEPDGTFFKIKGVDHPDTSRLIQYLEAHSYFFVDQYISKGQIPLYDSLFRTEPFAHFSVDALGLDAPFKIDFFPGIANENVILGNINDRDLGLFQKDRLTKLLKSANDFTK